LDNLEHAPVSLASCKRGSWNIAEPEAVGQDQGRGLLTVREIVRLLEAVFLVGLVATSAFGDTFTILDLGDTISVLSNGQLLIPNCTPGPEHCVFDYLSSGTITTTLPLNFNIYEDDAQTILSDTLAISKTASNIFTVDFFSDVEGGPPLVPLLGAQSITENGSIQTVATINFTSGPSQTIQFQSDVPEPTSILLLITVVGLLASKSGTPHRAGGLLSDGRSRAGKAKPEE
jgi:hypothetical protein